ncbi:VCBS repeat-containing protein, partial [Pseudoalteromonas sp. McH1-42]|uniref:FG-GAP repeat domain-containing protein n=1 Tax=Pseudoalteromonas sp. McH1-42 TaxID=2917752 RepID=UPI001EF44C18
MGERRFHDIATKTFRKTWKVIDYDKDGKDDILYMKGSSQYWQLMRHTSAMNFTTTQLTGISKPSSDDNTRFLDIDADGYPELLHFVGNKLSYQKGIKTGLASGQAKALKFNLSAPSGSTATMMSYDKEDNTFQAMDFNGDGRADFLAKVRVSTYYDDIDPPCERPPFCEAPKGIEPTPMAVKVNHVGASSSLADRFGGQVERIGGGTVTQRSESAPIIPVNLSQLNPVNMVGGPAASALLQAEQQAAQVQSLSGTSGPITTQGYRNSYYWKILVSIGNDTFAELYSLGSTSSYKDIQAVELNGDGLADILYRNSNNDWYARINTGTGFASGIKLFN